MDPTAIIRDPLLARNRIFIGNIPENCTREDLDQKYNRFGTILSILVQKNFAFVQFENEAVANKAASATSGSIFNGKKIVVRNAGAGKGKPKSKTGGNDGNMDYPIQNPSQIQQYNHSSLPPINNNSNDYNDCEVIVVHKNHTSYAEFIEGRLRRLGLKIDLLFPNEEVPIGKVLANISSRGCLYAILVTAQNEEHRSITVNILYGQPAEHRNMPVEDAIALIMTDFEKKMKEDNIKKQQQQLTMNLPIIPSNISVPSTQFKDTTHPDAIQQLLNLLADNLPLTVLQYDRIIKYLTEKREIQVKAELGDAADIAPPPIIQPIKNIETDPEIELQKKILTILNKPSITDNKSNLVYPTIQSLQNELTTIDLLKDFKVQKALDALMKTNLVTTIEDHYKFDMK